MELSEAERERIRQEELFRKHVQKDLKRAQGPLFLLAAAMWVVVLTALALFSRYLPWLVRK
jgi:hypothetical protein